MTEILDRAKPRIDHPEELNRLVGAIVRAFDPVAIYLFGSRARGGAREDSDYDLMVVVPDTTEDERAVCERLWQLASGAAIGATPFLSRCRTFEWRRREVGTLEHEVEVDGLQLYPKRQVPFPPTSPVVRRMNVKVVDEWLGRVEKDLTIARKGCEGDDTVPDQSAYHVQQAAEKLTKSALVAFQIRPGKGHDIKAFTALLPDTFVLKERFRGLERFSKFAWAFRYPEYPGQEPVPEPSAEDVLAWLGEVRTLKDDFEGWLRTQPEESS